MGTVNETKKYKLVATAAFGLESVVARELKGLGFNDIHSENGRVSYEGDGMDIARSNIWLRAADRVLIELARFHASDFEELYQGVFKIPWEEIIPCSGIMHVTGRSSGSKLSSVPGCQGVAKKAIIEAMKRRYRTESFPETGPHFGIEVALLKDTAVIYLDTTGPGLHKRGYRTGAGEAAIKETLAAGLILLSRWRPPAVLADPFCGSGTIAIEAAMIGKNMAPGASRQFASEQWPFVSSRVWEDARKQARQAVNDKMFRIEASDVDEEILNKARRNVRHAGVGRYVDLKRSDVREFKSNEKGGVIICNPPYGERQGEKRQIAQLSRDMGNTFKDLESWSFFIFTAFEEFERHFGRRADGNRKLYNARIKCYLYEYRNRS